MFHVKHFQFFKHTVIVKNELIFIIFLSVSQAGMLQFLPVKLMRCEMRPRTSACLLSLAILMSGCADQSFKAEEPVDYKDSAKYGFGSLVKGENSAFNKYFNKKNASDDGIAVEKVSASNPKDKLWNSAIVVLKDFPIEFMDKKSGRLETEKVKVKLFDSTETCSYKISVRIVEANNINVVVTSVEDSSIRLKKHAETIKSRIFEEYKR